MSQNAVEDSPFRLDGPTREELESWLTAEQINDPLLHEFAHRLRRAHAEEKTSDPKDWTPEQCRRYEAGDWAGFSRLRGYTEDEIANFGRFMELAYLLDERYGEDFAITVDFEITQFDESVSTIDP